MSDSVQPHRRQPTRLPHPWDSPGKNTAVGCHFLLQCIKVKSESEVTQSCPTLGDPTDCSLPGSSVHGIFQARVLERGARGHTSIPFQCTIWENIQFFLPVSLEKERRLYFNKFGNEFLKFIFLARSLMDPSVTGFVPS